MHMDVNRFLRRRHGLAALLIAAMALSAACGSKSKSPAMAPGVEPDQYLFDRGQEELKKKSWFKAREYFRQVVENYPQSRYRPEAKLGLADTYLGEDSIESLILGANEYREFLTFFPTSDKAAAAQYRLALTHYQQMLAPQRDQTQTRQAILEFQTLVDRFPDAEVTADGRKKLQECKDRLSGADYEVGLFYYKTRWYPGAISRFRQVLKENPTFGRRDGLYYYLADAYVRMGGAPEALPLLDKLSKEFEKSDFLLKGEALTTAIKDGSAMEEVARQAQKQADQARKAEEAAKKKQKKGP
jgi:outer membrane protein assembly factor BamD